MVESIFVALTLFVQLVSGAVTARSLNPGNPLGTTHEPPAVERPAPAPAAPPVETLPAEHPPVAAADATD